MNADDLSYEDIELSLPDAVSQSLFSAHLPLGGRDLGTDADAYLRTVRLRIGRRPFLKKLKAVHELVGANPVPRNEHDVAVFTRFESWLAVFHLSLLEEEGLSAVREFGCQVRYPERRSVAIVGAMPQSEQVIKGEFEIESSAEIGLTGSATIPKVEAVTGDWLELNGGVRAKQTVKAGVKLALSVVSPKVICTGVGDYVGEWSVRRDDKKIFGQQPFVHTLLTPKAMKALRFSLRAYVTVDTLGMFPGRLNTKWINFKVDLNDDGNVAIESEGALPT